MNPGQSSAPARSSTTPAARLVMHLAEPPVPGAALPPVLVDHVMVLGAEPVRQMAAALAVVRVVPVRSYNPVVPLECLKVDVELLLAALLVRRPGTVEGAAPQPADLRRRQADEQYHYEPPSLPTSSLLIVSAGLDPLMMRNTHSTSTLLPPWMFQWLSVPAILPVPLFALLFGFSFSSSRIQRVALYTRIVPSIEDGIELSEGKVKN
uniref:Uncharacterized protein n=1 Tax=Anopheles coluzzii TaxID=1518534 RepID=A0A8W7PW78_ANOCL